MDVTNVWTVEDLMARASEALANPNSWEDLVELIQLRFDRLLVSEAVLDLLKATTFYPAVAKRVRDLLGILQEYMEGRQTNGAAGPRSMELYQQFFTGERARFSDESDANKNEFEDELTFRDPEDDSKALLLLARQDSDAAVQDSFRMARANWADAVKGGLYRSKDN